MMNRPDRTEIGAPTEFPTFDNATRNLVRILHDNKHKSVNPLVCGPKMDCTVKKSDSSAYTGPI